jgi:hypothetical protein
VVFCRIEVTNCYAWVSGGFWHCSKMDEPLPGGPALKAVAPLKGAIKVVP